MQTIHYTVFDDLSKLKVILLRTWRNKWNWGKKLLDATHRETKERYLCCYKYRRRYLNEYLNIYSRESSFHFRGNSTIPFNHEKLNKQSKAGILIKLTKNLVIIASLAYGLGTKLTQSPSPCSQTLLFWRTYSPLSENVII